MQIRDLSKPVTSSLLNESLAKKFGYKLNLEQFSDVQLEDVRNKLRTEMSQFEVNESFDNLHSNAKYQKTRALLDVINQAILERELNEGAKPDFLDADKDGNKKETMKKAFKDKKKMKESNIYFATLRHKAQQESVPTSWINSAIQRITLGESDQEELAAELTLRYDLSESQATRILYLSEGESDKAEIIMATKDMVDRVTGWLEDVAAMKAEQLLELLDSIRETLGSDVAQQYQDAVKPALEQIYTALETSRGQISSALATVSGGEQPMMGGNASAALGSMGSEMGGIGGEELPPLPGGEGEEGMTPPAPEAGREMRESAAYSRRLGMLLASKKK